MSTRFAGLAGVVIAGLTCVTSARAVVITVGSEVGTLTLDSNLVGTVSANADGSIQWSGSMQRADLGWGLDWNLAINEDPIAGVVPSFAALTGGGPALSISGVAGFTNLLGATANFTFNVGAVSSLGAGVTTLNGASTITLLDTGTDGGVMAALAGGSIYDAVINGVSQQQLFIDPFSLNAPPSGIDFTGAVWGKIPGGPIAVGDLFGINHAFSLTAGDQATVNSSFFINLIPSPGSVALFGVAGLVALRRRR
ncbi:MAG: hypothetical protein D6693_03010 [Planctomycetota bacterium]|nr:MAG: hypothetical protein D6693_03010 [Planctomycetota bacterium]